MHPSKYNIADYIGIEIKKNHVITEFINNGMISLVFKVIDQESSMPYACKVIPKENVKQGWKVEVNKMRKLQEIKGVIRCYDNATSEDKKGMPFSWVLLNYVPGINLRQFILEKPFPLNLALIEQLSSTVLGVLFACNVEGFPHGDLHEGNILISESNARNQNYERDIWVTDFGYGGSQNSKTPKNDIQHFTSIVNTLLDKLKISDLAPMQKILYEKMKTFLSKRIVEYDFTQGDFVKNFRRLLGEFNNLHEEAKKEHEQIGRGEHIQDVGDYLQAEAMGERIEEWKSLFVPGFLGVRDLLSRNTTMLTGARGCGKTMAFKRLTTYMDKIIGESLDLPEVEAFCGFYLNSRYLKDAFPYIPEKVNDYLSQRLIHFFHLAWTAEILKTISAFENGTKVNYQWLDEFIKRVFRDRYTSTDIGTNVLSHIISFIEDEKEYCRFYRWNAGDPNIEWSISRHDYLDELVKVVQKNVSWAYDKPFFFFLDDYTIPTIYRRVQRVYNDIIFRRSNLYFFKISTEALNSFEPVSSNEKPLELHHDLAMIDMAAESIWIKEKSKKELIQKIFDRRIQRDKHWKDKSVNIQIALGKLGLDNNKLARKIRSKGKLLYHGFETFVGVWCSDIRTMVQIFAAMLNECERERANGLTTIPVEIQDRIYQSFGGEFLKSTEQVSNPNDLEKSGEIKDSRKFGSHLKSILQAFIDIANYELTLGSLMPNQKRINPKQAFRIEILDELMIREVEADMYLQGLLRWHIFLSDGRGKSIRGIMNNRYFMNRLMIPHARLTFSKKDHIHLYSHQFETLLLNPKDFAKEYKKLKREKKKKKEEKKKTKVKNSKQSSLF